MYTGRRRWLARSNSEPPFPAAWALQQPPPSAADERPKSPSAGSSGSDLSPPGYDQQPERGRPVKREPRVGPPTMEHLKLDEHAVGAGLNGHAAIDAARCASRHPFTPFQYLMIKCDVVFAAPYPKDETINAYPEKLGHQPHTQTFWIPFKLTPGGIPGTGRLTPINRRVPPHLRAAASALNLKMTYTKIGTRDYVFSHGGTPAPRTPHNERAPQVHSHVVRDKEKRPADEAHFAQPTVRFRST